MLLLRVFVRNRSRDRFLSQIRSCAVPDLFREKKRVAGDVADAEVVSRAFLSQGFVLFDVVCFLLCVLNDQ